MEKTKLLEILNRNIAADTIDMARHHIQENTAQMEDSLLYIVNGTIRKHYILNDEEPPSQLTSLFQLPVKPEINSDAILSGSLKLLAAVFITSVSLLGTIYTGKIIIGLMPACPY